MSQNCGSITVQPAFSGSNVSVSACAASGTFTPGQQVNVTVTVQNTNDVGASALAVVTAGSQRATKGVNVAANSTKQKTLQLAAPQPTGSYTVQAHVTNVTRSGSGFAPTPTTGRARAALERAGARRMFAPACGCGGQPMTAPAKESAGITGAISRALDSLTGEARPREAPAGGR